MAPPSEGRRNRHARSVTRAVVLCPVDPRCALVDRGISHPVEPHGAATYPRPFKGAVVRATIDPPPATPGRTMAVYDSLVDLVGGTPLVRLRKLTTGLSASVLVKVEYLNPGGSVKDRAATAMVLTAERDGALSGRGTIVEASSGNTGIGLAQAAAVRGHRIVVVVPDTVATEKVDMLRAYGAEVRQTPASLPREHPAHVNNLARRIAEQTPGGWFANQYDNPANPAIHYATTGPEIWAATEGRVTHSSRASAPAARSPAPAATSRSGAMSRSSAPIRPRRATTAATAARTSSRPRATTATPTPSTTRGRSPTTRTSSTGSRRSPTGTPS